MGAAYLRDTVMSGEDIFQKISRLEAEVAALKALVGPLLRGGMSTEHFVGVLPTQSSLRLSAVAANPAYVDGFAIIYFYSSGGVDELRVRGKVGATETQDTIADLSP